MMGLKHVHHVMDTRLIAITIGCSFIYRINQEVVKRDALITIILNHISGMDLRKKMRIKETGDITLLTFVTNWRVKCQVKNIIGLVEMLPQPNLN